MTKQFTASAFISLSACALLSGCASEPTCDYSEEPYMAATSVPSLTVPDGMSAPDRTATLVVPPAPEGEQPPGKGACLDRPPSYFATTPANKEPAAKESAATP
jgi:uncharacterized lipoprotein